jgi:hypothetical protein
MRNLDSERNNALVESARNLAQAPDWRRLSGPLLAAIAILLSAVVAVAEFDLPAGWASISAAAGLAVAGLWVV